MKFTTVCSFQGGLERAWCSGAIRSSYVILKPGPEVNVAFFAHLLKSASYVRALQGTADYIRDGQDLTYEDFCSVDLPLPPLEEQVAMAKYLDWVIRRIRRAMRIKQKLIVLLEEQKQAIINRAVTRGLDHDVRTKASGVEWLGDIPAGWRVVRIKNLLHAVDRRSTTGSEVLLSLRMHHGLVPFAEHFKRPPPSATLVGFKLVSAGQVVVNRMQAGNGLVFMSSLPGLVSPDYAVFDVVGDNNPLYLTELFRSRKARAKFRAESRGLGTGTSGFLRLYDDSLGRIHVAIPARREQDRVLASLDRQLESTNVAIGATHRELDQLREYRTRIICDVVTGKIDVREAASRLPEIDDARDQDSDAALINDDTESDEEADATEVEAEE